MFCLPVGAAGPGGCRRDGGLAGDLQAGRNLLAAFGHNAIWIRDPLWAWTTCSISAFRLRAGGFSCASCRDGCSISGRAAARDEFAAYIDENRSIRAQRRRFAGSRLAAYLDEVRPKTATTCTTTIGTTADARA
jgi:hypothetical protein